MIKVFRYHWGKQPWGEKRPKVFTVWKQDYPTITYDGNFIHGHNQKGSEKKVIQCWRQKFQKICRTPGNKANKQINKNVQSLSSKKSENSVFRWISLVDTFDNVLWLIYQDCFFHPF